MVEDYRIHHHIGRAQPAGGLASGWEAGRKAKKYKYVETYQTDAGEFTPEEWRKRIRREIQESEEEDLLERIKQHCREKCAWLHKEQEIEDYAMNCLAGRSYKHWIDFQEEIIWM